MTCTPSSISASDSRMNAMSNIHATNQFQRRRPLGPRLCDPLDVVLKKLSGMETTIAILRRSLDDLETEKSEIREHIENEIRARDFNKNDSITNRAKLRRKGKSKGQSTSAILAMSPPLVGSEGGVSAVGGLIPLSPSQSSTVTEQAQPQGGGPSEPSEQLRFQPPPQPPIGIDPPSSPRQGRDWSVQFNPSPKVKRVLDVNLMRTLVHDSPMYCVKFSQDGRWLAMGCIRTVYIYDVRTGVQTHVLDHGKEKSYIFIDSVCFRWDGKYLVTGASDGQIRMWNIAKMQIHDILEGHQAIIYSVQFSSNGRFIVSSSSDGTVRLWDLHKGTAKVLTIDDHYPWNGLPGVAPAIDISLDERYVAVGSWNAVLSIWEVSTGRLVQKLRGHKGIVYCVAFTPDGKRLISGSEDNTLKYWDVSRLDVGLGVTTALTSTSTTNLPCLLNFTSHEGPIYSIAVLHDSPLVISASYDRTVMFWDIRTGVAQCVLLSGRISGLYRLQDFSPTGNLFATADTEGQVRIWSYEVVD